MRYAPSISVMRSRSLVAAIIISLLFVGCASNGGMTDTGKGAVIGSLGGAALGALVDMHGNPWAGALIGAAGGALAGGVVGHFMDERKQNLAKELAPEINAGQAQVQMLPGNSLQVTTTGQTAFPPGSAVINPGFLPTLKKIAGVVSTYGKMTVTVIGHPDAGGTAQQQQMLAYKRAEAVRIQLIGMGVKPALVTATDNPGNTYTDGRVELILTPLQTS